MGKAKYPKVEMHFDKARLLGWFWNAHVWGVVDSGAGWAPTYRLAKMRASSFARRTLQRPQSVSLYFDDDGNPMEFAR